MTDHNKKIRILFVSHIGDFSGAPKCLFDIYTSLSPTEFETHVVLPDPGMLYQMTKQKGLKVYLIERPEVSLRDFSKFIKVIFSRVRYIIVLARYLVKHKIDVVHVNTSEEVYGGIAAWLVRRKVIWHVHEYYFQRSFREKYKFFLIEKIAKRIVCVSSALAEQFPRCQEKICVIYNGIKRHSIVDSKSRGDLSNFTFAVVGSLVSRKGQLDAIKAVRSIVAENQKEMVELLIIGPVVDTNYFESCRSFIGGYPFLASKVKFKGFIDAKDEIYRNVDVLICPFYRDPFPYVALEALSYGIPIIGYDCLGVSEMVDNNVNGCLVKVGDIGGLKDKMVSFLENSEMLKSMKKNAYQSSLKYSFDNFISQFSALYKEIEGA